jgi:phage shock protein C
LTNRFIVNRREAKLMGVGAGIADYTGVDPLIVRLGLVAALLLTGPLVIFLYVVTGLVAAER